MRASIAHLPVVDQGVATETFSLSESRLGLGGRRRHRMGPVERLRSLKSEALYVRFNESTSTFTSGVAILNGNNREPSGLTITIRFGLPASALTGGSEAGVGATEAAAGATEGTDAA